MKQIKQIFFVFAFLVMLSNVGWGQTTIVSEGLNNSSTLFTVSGGTYYTGNSASGDRPATSPFAVEGTHSYGLTNSTATLTSNAINTIGFNNITLTLRDAAFSISSTGNGMDAGDYIRIEISPNDGTTWYNTVEVLGNSNAYWAYSTGTGNASTPYDGNITAVQFAPGGGGGRTTDGYSTLTISSLPAVTNLKVRITLLNNASGERWVVDDFKIIGTPSGTSTVTAGAGTEPATLSSLVNTQVASALNFDFLVTDDNGSGGDASDTKISQIVINQGTDNDIADWTQAIQGALLTDGTITQTANVTINATNITIASIANALGELGYIADNGSKTYTLKIWLKNPLGGTLPTTIDGLNLVFGVNNSSFTFNGGSQLAASQDVNSGAANNAVSVVSTKLNFVMQPTNTNLNATMSPAVTIEATDANNNRDLDKTGSVTLVSSGTMTGVPSATLTNGFGTFSDIVHTVVGTGLSLTASLSGLTDATSNTFNISLLTPGLLLFEENFDFTGLLTDNGYTALSGTGTNDITASATGLTYTNYGSTGIGNAINLSTGQDVSKSFTQQNSPTTVYASFLVNISAATSTGDYVFGFAPSSVATNYRGRLFIKSSTTTGYVKFGIANSSGSGPNYGTTDFALNTTHLIVVKYQFTDATTATATVFVNPNLYNEPSSNEISITETGANAPADITSYALRQAAGNAPTLVMDGIRIATNWGTLLGNPSYSSADNINAGNYNNVSVLSGDLTLTGNVSVNGILTLTSGNIISTATNKLTLGTDATISGGSATSFVSGPLAKICNTTSEFTFHVGKGSSYLPLGIMPTTTANVTTYEAEYFNTPYSNTTSFGTSGLAGVSLNGYHELSRPSGTVPAVLRIYWDANSGVITTSDLRVAHWNSSLTEWENLGYNSITGGPSGGSLLTNSSVSSFSPFALGSVTNQPLPVNLSSLNSSIIGRNIKLNWTTASETNNSGFNVERMNVADNIWSKITFVSGHGTVNTPTNYSFEDRNLQTGKYKYRLKQIDVNGNFEYFALNGEVEIGVPKTFNLSQNYPNPFNPVTKINFDLPTDGKVTMLVYDITGREIARLLNSEYKKAGYYTTDFNAGMLSSGVYFYSLSADNFRMTKKMVLLK